MLAVITKEYHFDMCLYILTLGDEMDLTLTSNMISMFNGNAVSILVDMVS